MSEIDEIKKRIKNKKNPTRQNSYVNNLITRLLICLILFFSVIIGMNSSTKINSFVSDNVFGQNISFTKIASLYNKYFGSILPVNLESTTVFNETFVYDTVSNYKDGFKVGVSSNYLVPLIESGIVVFVGEKENYGYTVIVQGIDEVDYWYGNVQNVSVSLYDYVSKGSLVGTSNGDYLYLLFAKDGEYLDIDEVL